MDVHAATSRIEKRSTTISLRESKATSDWWKKNPTPSYINYNKDEQIVYSYMKV